VEIFKLFPFFSEKRLKKILRIGKMGSLGKFKEVRRRIFRLFFYRTPFRGVDFSLILFYILGRG
jgi:hypothetical protein